MTNKSNSQDSKLKAIRKVNEEKWTKPLMEAGWTVIPSIIIEKQEALGLDALDMNIILHLASYWWTKANKPHPTKKTIADALQVSPRTIQRRIARLQAAGLIRREERRVRGEGSKANRYHFDGLIKEATPFALEKTAMKEQRQKEEKERVTRRRPKLSVVGD